MEKTWTYEQMRNHHEKELSEFYNKRTEALKNLINLVDMDKIAMDDFNLRWNEKYKKLVEKHHNEMDIKLAQEKEIRKEQRISNTIQHIGIANGQWVEEEIKKEKEKNKDRDHDR